jgi:biopolymer transport protein ExbB
MKRYASSKMRIAVLAAVMLCIGMVWGRSLFGQTTLPAGTVGATNNAGGAKNAFSLVLENMDFVFVMILAASIWGVALIIQAAIKNRRSVFLPEATNNRIRELMMAGSLPELLAFTENDPTFVSRAVFAALKRVPSFEAMKDAMETSIGEQTADEFRKIEYLNVIGNLGPLLGLLGTVLGMIEAFGEMHAAGGQANPGQLAGGISKALAHTMLGLLLAVPCLAAFGYFRTIVDRLTVQGAIMADDLLQLAKPGGSGARPVAAQAAAVPTPARGGPPMPQAIPQGGMSQ